jgi:outer membrane protein TolC
MSEWRQDNRTQLPRYDSLPYRRLFASLLVSVSLQGCAVGPDYDPPSLALLPFHTAAGLTGKKPASAPALERWWSGFKDRKLVTIVERALAQNLDLAAAVNRLLTSRAFQPVSAGALRWRLFDFGKVDAEVAQANGGYAEALALYRQSVLKATEDVEDAFVALTQYELREGELRGEVASLTRSRDLSEDAYKAGAIPLTDVLDADRQLLAARDDLENNRTEAARAAVRSFRALGGGWS